MRLRRARNARLTRKVKNIILCDKTKSAFREPILPIEKYNLFLQYRILPDIGPAAARDYQPSVQIDQFTAAVTQLENED